MRQGPAEHSATGGPWFNGPQGSVRGAHQRDVGRAGEPHLGACHDTAGVAPEIPRGGPSPGTVVGSHNPLTPLAKGDR